MNLPPFPDLEYSGQETSSLHDQFFLTHVDQITHKVVKFCSSAGGQIVAQTPPSLLKRLREHPNDAEAWTRFDHLYRPLILAWLRRSCVQTQDADDLVQQVLEVVVREIPNFQYDPKKGRFRNWLRSILVNRLRDFWRAEQGRPKATGDSDFLDKILCQLEDPHSDLSHLWDQEHDQHVAQNLLETVKGEFAPTTWQAFQRVMAGEKAGEVATSLKISVNAVYVAKSAVLKRLRQEMEGLAE
jgi:RNA polymerase sigma-70 factor (ECF subfamily)